MLASLLPFDKVIAAAASVGSTLYERVLWEGKQSEQSVDLGGPIDTGGIRAMLVPGNLPHG